MEFDEAYVSVATESQAVVKRGKGSQKKSNVAVMAESTPLEDSESGKKSKSVRYFKMKVLENHKAEAVDEVLKESLKGKNIVFSDKSTSYVNISDYVEVNVSEVSNEYTTKNTLKWVHIAIANLKTNLLGVYHKIKGEYLQRYLNEFCYKLNRRYFGNKLFERLVIATTNSQWHVSR